MRRPAAPQVCRAPSGALANEAVGRPGPAGPCTPGWQRSHEVCAPFMLTSHAPCVPVAPARKGQQRSTPAAANRPRAGPVAGTVASCASLDAPSKLVWMRPSEHSERRPVRVAFGQVFGQLEHDSQSLLNGVDDPGGHLRGGLSVVDAHGVALVLAGPARGLMTHEFVDDPGRDVGVLQSGRVGMAEVVRAVQVHRIQQGVALGRRRRTAACELVVVLDVDRSQAGGMQLMQGERDRGRLDGATVRGQSGGELVDPLWPTLAQGLSTRRAVGRSGTARSASLARAPW
jgi:hypothetical protein